MKIEEKKNGYKSTEPLVLYSRVYKLNILGLRILTFVNETQLSLMMLPYPLSVCFFFFVVVLFAFQHTLYSLDLINNT